jgi:hypothetical protein
MFRWTCFSLYYDGAVGMGAIGGSQIASPDPDASLQLRTKCQLATALKKKRR